MSGSALSPFTVGLSYGKDLGKKFAGRFKCPTEPPSNMLQVVTMAVKKFVVELGLLSVVQINTMGSFFHVAVLETVASPIFSGFGCETLIIFIYRV